MKRTEDREILQEWIMERYHLSGERLREILSDDTVREPFDDYFKKTAGFMVAVEEIYEMHRDGRLDRMSLEELKELNENIYKDILPEAAGGSYHVSYANPAYSCRILGSAYGSLLSWLVTEVRGLIPLAFQERLEDIVVINELFIEIYNCFENSLPDVNEIRKIIYWYVSDYSDQTLKRRIREKLDPALTFYRDMIMNSDLNDLSYLYQYGVYISSNEREMAEYLNSMDETVIDGMARTLVQGYIRGFEIYKIDWSQKKTVQLRANIGFERVLRSVIRQFETMGLSVIVPGEAVHSINKTAGRLGLLACSPNPQYDHDHKMDKGLYLDKALCERIVGVTQSAYESCRELAEQYAGPVLMEVFGEIPFEPAVKDENVKLTEKQEKLSVRLSGQTADIANRYIDAASTSFSIIAWPLPSIGEHFQEIMDATIKVNNLDNDSFRVIQQAMIDAMDGASYMHITGMNGNTTDLKVALWQLQDPEKETVFENCCADVNIPVGEVFTSPVLHGTEGTLHVSGVYLNGLNYRNLKLTFKDGYITEYGCTNYEDTKANKDYIKQNLLQNRETLPMGEFAIGTNTTAYTMARRFGIGHLMPILIMEKTGPHFAVGDTCYSYSEDHKVYNQDGKEIVARENEQSRLRYTDPAKAYCHVHTDITIPYDEIGAITACFADGTQTDIIRNGRFALKGTEVLNRALD